MSLKGTLHAFLFLCWARRFGDQGLHGLSVHPGGIMTSLVRQLSPDVLKVFETQEVKAKIKTVEQVTELLFISTRKLVFALS
jgi:hypothetical protein